MESAVVSPPTPPCLTCGSLMNCTEDIDHRGDFYCLSCWELYEQQLLDASALEHAAHADPQYQRSTMMLEEDGKDEESENPGEEQRGEFSVVNDDKDEDRKLLLFGEDREEEEEEEEEEEGGGGGRGGAYNFSTQPLASQPTLHTQVNESKAAAAGTVGGTMDHGCGNDKENEDIIDYDDDDDKDVDETTFSIDCNDTFAHENKDEMTSDMHCLLTQAAVDDNGIDGTDGSDDDGHVSPYQEIHDVERRIHNEAVGFAERIINSHQRVTNLATDQSPVIEAVMTTTSDSHGDNVALSGLTEPTTQPEISLPTNLNRQDLSLEDPPSRAKANNIETRALSSVELPASAKAPLHDLPPNDGRHDDVLEDDASSAYNGLSEMEEEEEERKEEVQSFIQQANDFADKGKQQPMSSTDTNSFENKEGDGNDEATYVESTRVDVVDNTHVNVTANLALEPCIPQQEKQGVSVDFEKEDKNISSSDNEMEENTEHHEEGTGDTNVTFGSGYWSLYDGNTQKLPTEPSQVQELSAMESTRIQNSAVEAQMGEPTTVTQNCMKPNSLGTEESSGTDNVKDCEINASQEREGDNAQEVELRDANAEDDNCHVENISRPENCEMSPTVDAPQVEEVDEDETQLSQDLLSSPTSKSKQFDKLVDHMHHGFAVQDKSKNSSPTSNLGCDSTTQQRSPERISGTKTKITTAADSISVQNHSVNEADWLPSVRSLKGSEERVPVLLMPSPKPQPKSTFDDPIEPPLDVFAEVGSDTLSWSGNGHNYADHAIEDTQNDNGATQSSAFKRLCRESLSLRNDSSLQPSSVMKRKAKSMIGGEMSSIMKPKILRYNALTKVNYAGSNSAGSSSSSEAEFDDDDDVSINMCADHPKSQTDQRIRKQLEEVKAILPSVKEIQDIASRRQLSVEIVELKKSHHETVNKLKRENRNLLAQLRVAEESIRQKDKAITEKNALLDEQFKVIEQIKEACGMKLPKPAEFKSPVEQTNNKRKRASLPDNEVDDDDDDSDLPLSALRYTNGTSSNKKQRKSFGSSRTHAKTKKKRLSPTPSASSDTVSADTPLNVEPKSMSAVRPTLKNNTSRVLAPDVWKQLQEKGWRYQTGPEPHNKVYVPKDGATHAGTQLGIHFFDCDQVIAAAIDRGDIIDSCSKSTSIIHPVQPVQLMQDQARTKPTSDSSMDDSKFCGASKMLTLESARSCIDILANFVRKNDHERFVGIFFTPLWQRLREQGAGPEMKWRYDANRNPLAKCSWCFVPPTSHLGGKGKAGYDYFETEEQVALVVLKEVRAIQELSIVLADHNESFSVVFPVLERAVEEKLEYVDAKRGNSGSVRARRATSKFLNSPNSSPYKQLQKSDVKEDSVLERAQKSSSKKPISKITPESKLEKKNASMLKKEYKPSFHMSQTQGVDAVLPPYNRCSPRQDGGPLTGLNFFYSGIDCGFTIADRITRLGGKVVHPESLTVEAAHRKTFFLADYSCWRKMKYILANSLGVPMLHFQWIAELEQKFQECGTAKPFDSDLYKKYRLPLGLDLSRGVFPLQRASNARGWDPPGHIKGAGEKIFQGMTIALAIEEAQVIEWSNILSACGATIKTLSDIQRGKGRIYVDCCLLASTSLPPHSVSLPDYVSKLLRCLVDNVPLLDLAWAHQSIIQRKRLPVVGDARYVVSLVQDMRNTCHVSSIKSKSGARYEIGDLVQFTLGSKISSGRIVDIMFESQGRSCKLEIQLLDSYGEHDLIDYPSATKITVGESSLKGNILMLDTDDFQTLGYIHAQRNIFNRAPNDSQI